MWYEYENYPEVDEKEKKSRDYWCKHEWLAIPLIFTIVYDCKLCGMKKEDTDEYKKPKF